MQLDNKHENLVVLAFPSNEFGGQEPGSPAEIKAFAGKYGAKFPLFEKTLVNGADASPLWKHLKESAPESGLHADTSVYSKRFATSSPIAMHEVRPGDSKPTRFTSPGVR